MMGFLWVGNVHRLHNIYGEFFAWQFLSRESTQTWRNRLNLREFLLPTANFKALYVGFHYPQLTVHEMLEESKAGDELCLRLRSPDTLFI